MTNNELDENKLATELAAATEKNSDDWAEADLPAKRAPNTRGREQEKTPEKNREGKTTDQARGEGEGKSKFRLPSLRKPAKPIPQTRDEVTVKIEKIMEEGLAEAYSRLSPVAQQEFRLKGEETAGKIRELMRSTHVKIKKILRLLLEWLRILPGINRFFLEQEAKIKTDKIIALKNDPKYFNKT